MWEIFREAGPVAWLIVPAGLLGAMGAVVALILALVRPALAFRLGLSIAALGIVCAGLGAVGVAQVRAATEATVAHADVSPLEAEKIRRARYIESRSAAGLGLGCAVVPLLGGLTVLFVARRRRSTFAISREAQGSDTAPLPNLGVAAGVAGLGLVSVCFAVAALSAPLPARPAGMDEETRIFHEAVEAVGRTDGDMLVAACERLERALDREPRTPPADLPAAVKRCIDARIAQAVVQSPLSRVRGQLEAVTTSALVRRYPDLAGAVRADLAEVDRMIEADRERPWELDQSARHVSAQVRMGQITVHGPLPPEVVQRIVRQNFGRFRLCYENALGGHPDLVGLVTIRFDIRRDGTISSTSSSSEITDRSFVSCVQRAFASLAFPRPEGGSVSVIYPLHFSPPQG